MSLLNRLFGRKSKELTYDQIAALIDSNTGSYKVAGVTITHKTAMQVAAVLGCAKVIADGCATPDLHVYRQKDDGKSVLATNIPEYRLLNRRPNEWQTSFEWRRMMTLHAVLCGTGLSIKVKGFNGKLKELLPIQPGNWQLIEYGRYQYKYRVWDKWGAIGEFDPEDVFVIHGLQWEIVKNLDAVQLARTAIGLAAVTEMTHEQFHENGVRPSGIYSVEGTLNTEQYKALQKHVKDNSSGPRKTGEPMILDRNAKWLSQVMTGVDAQHIETRRFQVEEICRHFQVFPIMVMHSDKSATFASSEAFFSAHLKHTLTPHHRAWRDRLDETVLDGSGPLYTKFDTRYLTEGSIVDRAQWARTMVELGIYTRNELRQEEGMDKLPGLDDPLTPLNMSGNTGSKNEN